uniref:Uncharacterized protein n=1 Tax=Anguilla anguilla TaxID=7936 RepID=A0A0E9VYS4_ANGAN
MSFYCQYLRLKYGIKYTTLPLVFHVKMSFSRSGHILSWTIVCGIYAHL